MPLIGGYNDSEGHIRKVVALAKSVHAEKISLLPYHEGGKSKCDQLGRSYPFPGGESPTDEQIQCLQEIIETAGLKVTIRS
jgi:pyruvate formate lyase activating enzyme